MYKNLILISNEKIIFTINIETGQCFLLFFRRLGFTGLANNWKYNLLTFQRCKWHQKSHNWFCCFSIEVCIIYLKNEKSKGSTQKCFLYFVQGNTKFYKYKMKVFMKIFRQLLEFLTGFKYTDTKIVFNPMRTIKFSTQKFWNIYFY